MRPPARNPVSLASILALGLALSLALDLAQWPPSHVVAADVITAPAVQSVGAAPAAPAARAAPVLPFSDTTSDTTRPTTASPGRPAGVVGPPRATVAPYQNAKLPIPERVADLLARMTLEEKVAQLQSANWDQSHLYDEGTRAFSPAQARQLIPHGIGEVTRPGDKHDPRQAAAFANALQRYLVERPGLGIPAILHEEALHGLVAPGATSFPQAIALAATFDPELVEEVFGVTARQMRTRGVHHALAPVLDVARDPRWGRVEETFGEDTHLVERMGVAAVLGLQGHRTPTSPIDARHVLATGKHFAVHGQPEGGRNAAPANISERVVREVFLPPFEMAIRQAALGSVMASYNEVDGIPAHANHWLLGTILRNEWAFNGLVVSDYFGVAELERRHHVVADLRAAGRKALEAGVDIELPQPEGYVTLDSDVRDGVLAESLIDRAVARVLNAKMLLGLFERPYVDEAAAAAPERATDRELALRAAEEAIVLLKNEGRVLPLNPTRLKTLAVIGPNAAVCRLGEYSGVPTKTVSVLDGIRARLGNRVNILTAPGCGLTTGGRGWRDDEVSVPTAAEDQPLIAEAVRIAAAADAVVLVLGQNEQLSREGWADNHRGDRMNLDLPGRQTDLARAVLATGRPTVLVLMNGSPLTLGDLAGRIPAILEGFYLGEETGTAVAGALFGDVNPAGRLPITFPRSVGTLPAYHDYKPSARRLYLFEEPGPDWPFGFGLSYTTFEYGGLTVTPSRVPPLGRVTVSVNVTNSGKRAGDEVVQLYIHDLVSSVTRPVQELKGFRRIHLRPGEARRVDFSLGPRELSFIDERMQRTVEPGTMEVMVGGCSTQLVRARFEITP
jgi:beta-glucosidase